MPDFPKLIFLPVESLLFHERHDARRARPLAVRMRSSGVLRDSPIVAPFQDDSGRYMVLDGSSQIIALRQMGFPHALAQVVEPGDPGLGLQNWNHVVWEMSPARFLAGLRCISGLRLRLQRHLDDRPNLEGNFGLVLVKTCRGRAYAACAESEALQERVDLLNVIVDCYKDRTRLDRTTFTEVRQLIPMYPNLCALVIFPKFNIQDLSDLVRSGALLPAGITRTTVAPRALHVNLPLDELTSERSLAEKNARLQRLIRERLLHGRTAYYAEATFMFDE